MNSSVPLEQLVTEYEPKPIPTPRFDWCATRKGYEPGDPIGYGKTEAEAIAELKEYEGLDEAELQEIVNGR